MRLTDEQIKTLSSILPPTPGPATATAPVPPRVVTDTKPPAVDPRLSPPVKQPTTTPAARPYVIYCQCCKNELALPAGQKAPPACPSCGRAKARIYETNDQGQKVLVGTGDWYWPKGARTGLRPGQWCE
jgi:hypothetical protein